MSLMPINNALSTSELLKRVRGVFKKITDHRKKKVIIPMVDALMSGLAIFVLKFPSLLKFDEARDDEIIRTNLKNLFDIDEVPCDTQLRTILDPVEPTDIKQAYREVHECLVKQGIYREYKYFGYHLVLTDGTGHYCSGKISCPECCSKKGKNGSEQYYHQLFAGVLAHPDRACVLPFAPEAITRQDGQSKNDCERAASKRFLMRLKDEHPKLKALIVEDSLSGNGPHIRLLKSLGYSYVIMVKASDHAALFEQVHERMVRGEYEEFESVDEHGVTHGYRFMNGLYLNKSNSDILVNYLDYWELDKNGVQTRNFTWITDIELTQETVHPVMRIGRCRWKVENETFNTLKNLDYQLEHNYGHGQQHLATNFGLLCVLAFLLDQVQALGCLLFQKARQRFHSNTSLWAQLRALFTSFYIRDWDTLWQAIIYKHIGYDLQPMLNDTS